MMSISKSTACSGCAKRGLKMRAPRSTSAWTYKLSGFIILHGHTTDKPGNQRFSIWRKCDRVGGVFAGKSNKQSRLGRTSVRFDTMLSELRVWHRYH